MENQNKKKKTAITIILIAVLIAALALVAVACSFTGSQAEEPEESASPTESAEPADASPKPASTAKPAATAAPASTAAPGETGSTGVTNTGSTGSTNTGSTDTANGNQDKEEEHQHSWTPVYTTVHHEESGHYETVTIQAAYDEQEMMWETVCNVCGRRGGDVPEHIIWDHNNEGSYHSEQVPTGNVIHHDAVTEQKWVVDSPSYDEQVISHYVCSCGQTRSK